MIMRKKDSSETGNTKSGSKLRIFLLLSVLLFTAVYYGISKYLQWNNPQRGSTGIVTFIEPAEVDKLIQTVLSAPPNEMRSALNDGYRLKPDRRFLLAVAEVHHFFSKERQEDVSVKFENGNWNLRYRGLNVATVPELPDFSNFMTALAEWIKQLQQKYPMKLSKEASLPIEAIEIEKRLEKFLISEAMEAMQLAQTLWSEGNRHPVFLRYATQALTTIAFQGLDRLEIADMVPAKALAFLALTKNLTAQNVISEECLISDVMKYSAQSVKQAELLTEENLVRIYVTQDNEKLKKAAMADGNDFKARYFWLQHLGLKGDKNGWLKWLETGFKDMGLSATILKTALELTNSMDKHAFPRVLRELVFFDLSQPNQDGILEKEVLQDIHSYLKNLAYYEVLSAALGHKGITEEELIDEFESNLKVSEKKYKGPFLDAEVYRAHFQGLFYSSLYIESLYYIDSRSSTEQAATFVRQLGYENVPLSIRFPNFINKVLKMWNEGGSIFAFFGKIIKTIYLETIGTIESIFIPLFEMVFKSSLRLGRILRDGMAT
jgi:hypothetical protein